ncbi:hypothetical protein T4A_6758 [Trichinella pseudospiralis]|uniref:Uncharacterized protein n=1 Tax=Trichinella pseudospiralis TaxID=6337 RepID=A0A0V1EYA0_TRIPS|nr:hypothetical protein T4A_6758 [Trichinella pseudospiralis]
MGANPLLFLFLIGFFQSKSLASSFICPWHRQM